ncbi:MAG TPA: hypothetical protein PLP20_04140, partial [Oscillospiraceae bacterium]|nr:hypothetical protein [Oscillospiraceae bacterium]
KPVKSTARPQFNFFFSTAIFRHAPFPLFKNLSGFSLENFGRLKSLSEPIVRSFHFSAAPTTTTKSSFYLTGGNHP